MIPTLDASAGALDLRSSALADVGRVREHNEDRVLVVEGCALYLLADGAGGHNAGEVAAALALQSISNFFRATESLASEAADLDDFGLARSARRLSAAMHKANRDVVEISKKEQRYRGMGTTVVAMRFDRASRVVHVAHVGDSRAYRLRAGYLDPLTEDHSLLNDVLEERPDVSDAVISRLPTHVVTRALGMGDKIRVTIRSLPVAPGDRYLLCSDGLSGLVGNSAIADALAANRAPEDAARNLIALANDAGGHDNIAAVVVDAVARPDAPVIRMGTLPSIPPVARSGSEPEILVLGIEEVSLEPEVTLVPEAGASSDLIAAIGELIGPPGVGRRS